MDWPVAPHVAPASTNALSPFPLSNPRDFSWVFGVMPIQSLFLSRSLHRLRFSFPKLSTSSSSMSSARHKPRLRGLVFDMDGTLTIPVIDFPSMYRSILGSDEYSRLRKENPAGIDILGLIDGWPEPDRRRAYQVIADHEKIGLDRLQIMPGAVELCGFLDSKRLRRGLITRNVQEAVDLFHRRFGITFSPALSREFRPYKPDPAPLLHICSNWNIQPNEVMMVGDSVKDDIVCGKRAGAFTCLLDQTGRYNSPEYNTEDLRPDFKVSRLDDIFPLLEDNFDLVP
ncbi:hypothetical protein MLD38_016992 [Melastoma candidum]|uniref:Uncharacterized protein n=1 Tax=Melastoma candidum TaxID=119954 RepID=A0ACB9QPS3_9MYRT|nr:hypothetical protein MLD38_016992 [Melastoma candidum]